MAGLYDPAFEHDACGIGFVANIKETKATKTFRTHSPFWKMEHRGACGCENNTGDGADIMIQTPHEFSLMSALNGVHLPRLVSMVQALSFSRENCA